MNYSSGYPVFLLYIFFGISCAQAQNSCIDVGVNLEAPGYFRTGEHPFMDYWKFSSPAWLTFIASEWDSGEEYKIALDENGYPKNGIPDQNIKVRSMISSKGRLRPGRYVFFYDGEGSFRFSEQKVIKASPGRMVLEFSKTGNIWLDILKSKPAPDHLRNFRLVPLEFESRYKNETFRPEFLDKLKPFSVLRFMDWFQTNGHKAWKWDQRTTPGYRSQSSETGIAYEYAIDLSNKTKKHAWVNVPHMADDDYIRKMAELFRETLNPELKIYLEYSNEVWNWSFQQAQWNMRKNRKYDPPGSPENTRFDPNKNYRRNIGIHASHIFKIWEDVFSGQKHRLVRVAATQTGSISTGQELMDELGDGFDALAVTFYFGGSSNVLDQLRANRNDLNSKKIVEIVRKEWLKDEKVHARANAKNAAARGKRLISYEGGPHIIHSDRFRNDQDIYDKLVVAEQSQEMRAFYNEVIDTMRSLGMDLLMPFVLGGDATKWGYWGHIDNVFYNFYDPKHATKYKTLLENRPIELSANVIAAHNGCNGYAAVNVKYGSGKFSYEWNDPDKQAAATALNLCPGNYRVRVNDIENNCAQSMNIVINEAP